MKTIKIPDYRSPYEVIVNGVKQIYSAGANVEVTDEIADIIEASEAARLPEAPAADSGFDWDSITDKPFTKVGGDTLTWDGNTEGLVSVAAGDAVYYCVSDAVPSIIDFSNGVKVTYFGGITNEYTADGVMFPYDGVLSNHPMEFIVIAENAVGVDHDGFVFPKAGVYLPYLNSEQCISSLTIPGYGGFVTETLDPAYLPEHSHKWNDIEDKPFTTVGGDTLTWDGNTEGLVSTGGDMCYKVSDIVPTKADFINGCTIMFVENISGDTVLTIDGETAQASFYDDGCAALGNGIVIISSDNYEIDGDNFPEKGIYFAKMYVEDVGGVEVSSLTINGYDSFPKHDQLNESALPYLTDANGVQYKLTVSTDGVLSAVAV